MQVRANNALLQQVGVRHYDVLPFHRLGAPKYAALGRPYEWEGAVPPPPGTVDAYRQWIREAGMSAEYLPIPQPCGVVIEELAPDGPALPGEPGTRKDTP